MQVLKGRKYMQSNDKIRSLRELPPEWERLIRLAEKMKFGKAEIVFKNGLPTDIKLLVPHIKLDGKESEFEESLKTIPL